MTSSVFLFAIFFAWVAWFVLTPLYRGTKNDFSMILDSTPDTYKQLQAKRSELMLSLKDLDFDFETGKLSKEDYQGLRDKYQNETIEILKQIDVEKDLWNKFQATLDKKLGKNEA